MSAQPVRRGRGRPHAASREVVEQAAIALMQRDGYENVTVDAIVSAAGIGRTTFFRYFRSKPGVIWYAFDDTIARLAREIEAAEPGADPLDVVRAAVVVSTRDAVYDSDVWLERFKLLDTVAELRAESYEHWERWKRVITGYLAGVLGAVPDSTVPMVVAGAFHGGFVAQLRGWLQVDDDRAAFIARLDESLRLVASVLGPLCRTDSH
ncbi:TetR family transcriptional regulator [Amycolatopsis sp.]|uniref:acyl-CoA-like ligand-binding transcription factor n=1 Tax=Amycolatopsis sp. TaxID=37632 RepID=UPI002BBF0F2C|nr:TetR family transcriptional regulator [Amycolatopsis sp.]HVV10462.1 TetR family transcriptional regulator [Amycolatopsis sp.]